MAIYINNMSNEKMSDLYSKENQEAEKQKKLENEKSPNQKKIEEKWTNFNKIFWLLFIFKVVIKGIFEYNNNLNEQTSIIFFVFQFIPIILMAVTMAYYAYKFSEKKSALFIGLLGFFWFAIIGIFIGYWAVERRKRARLDFIKSQILTT